MPEYSQPHRGWWAVDEDPPRVEDDTVIGFGALVVGGVTIGPRSYIAAGAVITRDVPAEHIATGVNELTPAGNWTGSRLQDLIGHWRRRPWDNLVVWFLAQFHQPADLTFGLTIDEAGHQPVATFIAATDGSWSEVDHHADVGHHELREGGPTPPWRYIENAHQLWHDVGRPGWERFGVTVTADHQHVWLDAANNTKNTWPLERAAVATEWTAGIHPGDEAGHRPEGGAAGGGVEQLQR